MSDALGLTCQHGQLARVCELCEAFAGIDRLTARVAELERGRDMWIRRADKTWHEEHFADRIAALEASLAERDKVIEQARVELEAVLRHFTKVPSTLADSKALGGVHDGLQIEGIQR